MTIVTPTAQKTNCACELLGGSISANIGTFSLPTSGEKRSNHTRKGIILYICPVTVNPKNPKNINQALAITKGSKPDIRYEIPNGKYLFEVDEFHGANEGLTIAEIELENEKDFFEHPDWLGEEVTGDIRYYNSQLSKNPFTEW